MELVCASTNASPSHGSNTFRQDFVGDFILRRDCRFQMGVSKMVGLQGKIPLKWMIWGYPYFRKPPYVVCCSIVHITCFDICFGDLFRHTHPGRLPSRSTTRTIDHESSNTVHLRKFIMIPQLVIFYHSGNEFSIQSFPKMGVPPNDGFSRVFPLYTNHFGASPCMDIFINKMQIMLMS